ncbi:MAG: glycosyltransferase, partial [Pararhodobacter sp.]
FRMFRRCAWERTTRFREDIVNGVDYDIFLKMAETGDFHHVNEVLYQRRWHGDNTSSVNEEHQTANTYRVQRETLRRLGMDQHWDIHVPDPSQPRLVTHRLKPDTRMVVFWPDYSRANPYQKLLYRDLRHEAEVVSGTIEAALKLIADKVVDARDLTFHLHWLNALLLDCQTEEIAQARADDFVAKIRKFIWKGGRFVWTIHNSISHDARFADIETGLSARLAAAAQALYFHARASIDEVAAVFPVPREKAVVLPHGHYIGVYPDCVPRESARALLGIAPDEDVIVFTGQIRGYKGISSLIAAFRRLLADRPKARLILAGAVDGPDPLGTQMPPLTQAERDRILCVGRFVEDGEMQLFLRAADMAAYPYEKILTSGSLLLALSYGVPCVVPRVGMTAEVLEGRDAGVLYEAKTADRGLEAALRSLLALKDSGQLATTARKARQASGRSS